MSSLRNQATQETMKVSAPIVATSHRWSAVSSPPPSGADIGGPQTCKEVMPARRQQIARQEQRSAIAQPHSPRIR